eukprot:2394603-Pleurochrysis_carterae.AAC.1
MVQSTGAAFGGSKDTTVDDTALYHLVATRTTAIYHLFTWPATGLVDVNISFSRCNLTLPGLRQPEVDWHLKDISRHPAAQ